MYSLRASLSYKKSLDKIIKNNETLKKRLMITLQKLALDPSHPSLKSHKVNTKDYGERWSSWVTGDIRIIWDYDNDQRLLILLLDLGSHTGTHKVYK